MPTPEYLAYLGSPEWAVISTQVKARAGNRCQVCNSAKGLETHHRSYRHLGNELNHLSDLICLCRKCHGTFHIDSRLVKAKQKTRLTPEERRARRQLRMKRRLERWSDLNIRIE